MAALLAGWLALPEDQLTAAELVVAVDGVAEDLANGEPGCRGLAGPVSLLEVFANMWAVRMAQNGATGKLHMKSVTKLLAGVRVEAILALLQKFHRR